MVTLLYRMLQSTLEYDRVIQRTWVMAAGKNIAFKIAAKPLQTETWLLLTAIYVLGLSRRSPIQWYRRRLPLSHNTRVTDGQTTYQTQG